MLPQGGACRASWQGCPPQAGQGHIGKHSVKSQSRETEDRRDQRGHSEVVPVGEAACAQAGQEQVLCPIPQQFCMFVTVPQGKT